MKKTLIVANFKENFTVGEARKWVEKFKAAANNLTIQQFSNVIICPSFVVLPTMAKGLSKLENVNLGAQDVSKFEEGQYTGEVSAKMLKDFVDYVIVGHSERRKYFGETDGDVVKKSVLALRHNLIPIVCVSTVEEARRWKVPARQRVRSQAKSGGEARKEAGGLKLDKAVFAYEPLFAVGTGRPDTPENANDFAKKIKTEVGQNVRVLYGGSVTAENVKSFVSQPDIDGVLVGQASLDAEEFTQIVKLLHC